MSQNIIMKPSSALCNAVPVTKCTNKQKIQYLMDIKSRKRLLKLRRIAVRLKDYSGESERKR